MYTDVHLVTDRQIVTLRANTQDVGVVAICDRALSGSRQDRCECTRILEAVAARAQERGRVWRRGAWFEWAPDYAADPLPWAWYDGVHHGRAETEREANEALDARWKATR